MKEWYSIEEIIAEFCNDPYRAQLLREARQRLAPHLYPKGSARYERMMRGEGPPKHQEREGDE